MDLTPYTLNTKINILSLYKVTAMSCFFSLMTPNFMQNFRKSRKTLNHIGTDKGDYYGPRWFKNMLIYSLLSYFASVKNPRLREKISLLSYNQ